MDPAPVTGVYVIDGPAGVYVGQALDCFGRNDQAIKLGLAWGIVREMPSASKRERMLVETAVAEAWAARGFTIVSRNTREAMAAAQRGRKLSLEHRNKIGRAQRGRIQSVETIEKIKKALRVRPVPVERRLHISQALRGRKLSQSHRTNVVAAVRRRYGSV